MNLRCLLRPSLWTPRFSSRLSLTQTLLCPPQRLFSTTHQKKQTKENQNKLPLKETKKTPRKRMSLKATLNALMVKDIVNTLGLFEHLNLQTTNMKRERHALVTIMAELMSPIEYSIYIDAVRVYRKKSKRFRTAKKKKKKKKKIYGILSKEVFTKEKQKEFKMTAEFIKTIIEECFNPNTKFLETLFIKHASALELTDLETTRLLSRETNTAFVAAVLAPGKSQIFKKDGRCDVYRSNLLFASANEWVNEEAQHIWQLLNESAPYPVFVDNLGPGTTARDVMASYQRCGDVYGVELFCEELRGELLDAEESQIDDCQDGIQAGLRTEVQRKRKRSSAAIKNQELKESVLRTTSGRSVIYAVVYFKTQEGHDMALRPDMRHFGCLVNQHMAHSSLITEKCTLYLGRFPLLTDMASTYKVRDWVQQVAGIDFTLIKEVKGFNTCTRSQSAHHNPNDPDALIGFCYVEFFNHQTALSALRALQTEAHTSGASWVVGWASFQSIATPNEDQLAEDQAWTTLYQSELLKSAKKDSDKNHDLRHTLY